MGETTPQQISEVDLTQQAIPVEGKILRPLTGKGHGIRLHAEELLHQVEPNEETLMDALRRRLPAGYTLDAYGHIDLLEHTAPDKYSPSVTAPNGLDYRVKYVIGRSDISQTVEIYAMAFVPDRDDVSYGAGGGMNSTRVPDTFPASEQKEVVYTVGRVEEPMLKNVIHAFADAQIDALQPKNAPRPDHL